AWRAAQYSSMAATTRGSSGVRGGAEPIVPAEIIAANSWSGPGIMCGLPANRFDRMPLPAQPNLVELCFHSCQVPDHESAVTSRHGEEIPLGTPGKTVDDALFLGQSE